MNRFFVLLAILVAFSPFPALGQSTKIGLPVVFVHGFCGNADDFIPLEAQVKSYLQTRFPTYYQHASNGHDEYVAFYNGSSVVFQLPGSSATTSPPVSSSIRFFLVALDDPKDSFYEDFDAYSVAQIPIEAKGDELAHILWRVKQITGAPRVIVIGHSMGGLDSRAYIEQLAEPTADTVDTDVYFNDIASLITLDTPHAGSPYAATRSFPWPSCILQDSQNKDQMAPGSSLLSELNYRPGTAVATALPAGLILSAIVSTWSTSGPVTDPNAPLVVNDTDNVVSGESQDITQAINDPATNSQSELAAEPNVFLAPFKAGDGSSTCGVDSRLHFLTCSGFAPQTVSLIDSLLEPRAILTNSIPITPSSSTIAVGSSIQFSAATASGKPPIWSLLEGASAGNIYLGGLYVPPSSTGTYHVVAIDPVTYLRYGMITITVVVDKTPPTIAKWSVTPPSVTMGGLVTVSYTATDTGGAGLTRAELWRAPDSGGKPGTWAKVGSPQFLSGNGPAQVTLTDPPNPAGKYWYGTRLYDRVGNVSSQPAPVAVTVVAAKPVLTVTPSTGAQGTTFTFSATGLTPNNSIEGFLTDPAGDAPTLKSMPSSNTGTASWAYVSQCTDPLGKWTAYLIDFYANLKSNTVTATFTAGNKCNPIPAIKAFAPASLQAGSAAQKLTITGTGFAQGATATFNGAAHKATWASATSLSIPLTAADLATMGSFPVVVTNPAPGGGASAPVNFTVTAPNPVPTADWFIPSPLVAGSAAQKLAIHGTGFLQNSTVKFNGVAHTPTYGSATLLTISLTAADLAKAGNYPVVVTNPAPGGGASSPDIYLVLASYLVPTIRGLTLSFVAPGSAAQTLTISGTGFFPTSSVTFNGVAHTPTYLGATSLTIALTKTDLAKAGNYPVMVTNPKPGGGASAAASFSVSVSPTTWVLTVSSTNPSSGVAITASPADNHGLSSGATSFPLTYNENTLVTLTAPATAGGNSFASWTGCDSAPSVTCTVTMTAAKAVTANFTPSTTQTAHFSYGQIKLIDIFNPTGIAVDESGNVFVTNYNTNTSPSQSGVYEILAAVGYTTVKNLSSGFKPPYGTPFGVAVDGSGNVYIADPTNGVLQEILAAGGYTTIRTLGSAFRAPFGVAVDRSGNVFLTDNNNNAVKEILVAGGYTTVRTLGSGFNSPVGIALDGNGNVYVGDHGNSAVKEILAASDYAKVKSVNGSLGDPWYVAVDGSGNIFVTYPNSNTVREIVAAGDYTTVKTLGSGFYGPLGVAADGSGNVFVTDNGHGRVVELKTGAVDFGTVAIGQTSATVPLTFTFDKNGTLGTFAATNGGSELDFATAAGSTCAANTAYTAGATCTVYATFAPKSVGLHTGTVVLMDGTGNTIATAYIQGTGTN